ncbi:DUF742 domain-containing protein [Actinomadura luteofluorescens]|uniref:DUF742 domain-containing protein n=1 Tax=Actinomadura luteofluorescens TaxID=46163 RepID=UPI0036445DC9
MDPSDGPGAPRGPGRERWLDAAAGPIVRPYAVTRGRTRPSGEPLDIVAILVATGRPPPEPGRLSRQQRRLLALCRRPHALADLASDLNLPFGVIRVLARRPARLRPPGSPAMVPGAVAVRAVRPGDRAPAAQRPEPAQEGAR